MQGLKHISVYRIYRKHRKFCMDVSQHFNIISKGMGKMANMKTPLPPNDVNKLHPAAIYLLLKAEELVFAINVTFISLVFKLRLILANKEVTYNFLHNYQKGKDEIALENTTKYCKKNTNGNYIISRTLSCLQMRGAVVP